MQISSCVVIDVKSDDLADFKVNYGSQADDASFGLRKGLCFVVILGFIVDVVLMNNKNAKETV